MNGVKFGLMRFKILKVALLYICSDRVWLLFGATVMSLLIATAPL